MSKMLQALKNLSSRSTSSEPAEKAAAPPVPAAPLVPPAAEPLPTAVDPVLPPLNRTQRMKQVLARHLAAPTPTEIIRRPVDDEPQQLPADFPGTPEAPAAGSMTVPIESASIEIRRVANRQRVDFLPQQPAEPDPAPPAPSPTAAADSAEPVAPPSLPDSQPVDASSPGAITRLLSQLGDEPSSPDDEVSLSFSRALQERRDKKQEPAVREQGSEVGGQGAGASGQQTGDTSQGSVAPFPALPLSPPLAATPSPLDHLADPRPLVTFDPSEEPSPAPAPVVLPPRSISRLKTRLEERVLDSQSDPSRSLPYRELADRLRQDLRQLPGRCLLFAGVGAASHADDVLPHVASLLAEDDAEVLLVDADFTRAAMTVGFGALKETGLGDLAEAGNRGDELVLPTRLPNVSLFPAGRKALPDNLGVVDRVGQLLAKLEERFSLVLIDGGIHTGPLLPALARLCDATYLVVRLGATDARAATTALKSFRATGARVMGCVATSPPAGNH